MDIKVLASSSSGNCYEVGNGSARLLLDCGLRFNQIQQMLDFQLSTIDGILLSHAHKDHSRSIPEMMKAGIDVYMSRQTAESTGATGHRLKIVEPLKSFSFGSWMVLPFELQHDVHNLGYLVRSTQTGETLLYATDTCYLKYRFDGLTDIMIEVNHCRETLDANVDAGIIDPSLRNRIVQNHMGLQTAIEFFKANDLSQVNQIILLHLSDSNSQADRILKEVQRCTGKAVKIA